MTPAGSPALRGVGQGAVHTLHWGLTFVPGFKSKYKTVFLGSGHSPLPGCLYLGWQIPGGGCRARGCCCFTMMSDGNLPPRNWSSSTFVHDSHLEAFGWYEGALVWRWLFWRQVGSQLHGARCPGITRCHCRSSMSLISSLKELIMRYFLQKENEHKAVK